jgi:hypothetical protein
MNRVRLSAASGIVERPMNCGYHAVNNDCAKLKGGGENNGWED